MEKKDEFYYVFKTGKYKGMCLEWVFVKDPLYVAKIYADQFARKPKGDGVIKNDLQLAVDSLVKKLEKLELTQDCPLCGKGKVEHFLIPNFGRMSVDLVTCDSFTCKRDLQSQREGTFYKLSEILVIIPYLNKKEGAAVIEVFKNAHNLDILSEIS